MTETRLWKSYGVTHAVTSFYEQWNETPNDPIVEQVVTLCHRKVDVPWRNTCKRRMSKIDCMGCLVALGRL